MSIRSLIVLLCLILLDACAMVHPAVSSGIASGKSANAVSASSLDTSEMFYKDLIGEISNQEGSPDTAIKAFTQLAKQTHDSRFAARAVEVALHYHKIAAAEEAAKLWTRMDPKAVEPVQILAVIMLDKEDLDGALPYVEAILNHSGGNDDVIFANLDNLVSRVPDQAKALQFALLLVSRYPSMPQAHIFAGESAFRAAQFEVAIREADAALTLKPDSPQAAVLKGVVLGQSSPDRAVKFLEEYLSHYNDPDVRLVYARTLVSIGRFKEARREFENLVKTYPYDGQVNLAIGLLSAQINDWKTAHEYFLKALTLPVPDKDQVRLYLGQAEQGLNQPDKARAWYLTVPKGPHYLTAQIRVAGILSDQGKNHEALATLTRLVPKTLDDKIDIGLAKAEVLRRMKKNRQAYDLLGELLKKSPDNPDLLYAHALSADRIGLAGVFESNLRLLIKLRPNDGQAYNALGYTLANHNERLVEAGRLLNRAQVLLPGDPFVLDSLGWLQYRLGHLDDALVYLEKAYMAYPDPEIGAHLGEVLWKQGNETEARKIWHKALLLHPDNRLLKQTIKQLEH
ncbi:MAG TPA: tetratricopeptide repeat protein [Burkholderiales bacterium]|nr:tetratricopeptide repeat protein [Burkholderiales bacterium]